MGRELVCACVNSNYCCVENLIAFDFDHILQQLWMTIIWKIENPAHLKWIEKKISDYYHIHHLSPFIRRYRWVRSATLVLLHQEPIMRQSNRIVHDGTEMYDFWAKYCNMTNFVRHRKQIAKQVQHFYFTFFSFHFFSWYKKNRKHI